MKLHFLCSTSVTIKAAWQQRRVYTNNAGTCQFAFASCTRSAAISLCPTQSCGRSSPTGRFDIHGEAGLVLQDSTGAVEHIECSPDTLCMRAKFFAEVLQEWEGEDIPVILMDCDISSAVTLLHHLILVMLNLKTRHGIQHGYS